MLKLKCSFFVVALLIILQSNAEIGCIDNSWHLSRPFDDKEYHYVQCACPCSKKHKILADRRQCLKCKHFHDAHPFIIIEPSKENDIISRSNISIKAECAQVVIEENNVLNILKNLENK